MTDARRRELELVAELVLNKADLKMTKAISLIAPLIDKKIQEYDDRQTRRRQWMARTLIAVAGLALTAIALSHCVG